MADEQNAAAGARPTAVALLDALGFKEARKKHGADALIATVQATRSGAASDSEIEAMFGAQPVEIAALSDTLVMTRASTPRERDAESAICQLAERVAQLICDATTRKVPLPYRGCIAFGPLVATDGIFVGEPIDTAAEWYNEAAAAVVWLTPDANTRISRNDFALVEWTVPLRGRGTLLTHVVNPFWTLINEHTSQVDTQKLRALQRLLLAPLLASTAVDVVQKHQNTAAFLEVARRSSLDMFDRMEPQGEQYTPEVEEE